MFYTRGTYLFFRELRVCENKKNDMRNLLKTAQNDLRKELEAKRYFPNINNRVVLLKLNTFLIYLFKELKKKEYLNWKVRTIIYWKRYVC